MFKSWCHDGVDAFVLLDDIKLIVYLVTQFILEYLSFPPERFALFFQVENSFPQYVTALIFRIIANLHCYNPSVSPPDQKHYLINKIYYFFTTIFVPNAEGEITRTSNVSVHCTFEMEVNTCAAYNCKHCYEPVDSVSESY